MDHVKKLAFIANMTDKALQHVASTPNIAAPNGGMSHEKMLSFVTSMAKHGLQHFDSGGTTLSGPTNQTSGSDPGSGGVFGGLGDLLGIQVHNQAQGTPIQAGTNSSQLNNAYTGAQGALSTQGGITNTLNQGLNTGASNQNTLSNMYLNQAQGNGPNPAQAMLNQNTGRNIQNQASLMAGQRGAGANAGAIAANAARQGADIQQQAVGQGAIMSAQQQLAAEQNLQNLSANQISQGQGATQGLNNATQNEQNILQGANTANNNANVSMQSNINNVNAGIAQGNQNSSGNLISGIGGLASSLAPLAFLSTGGAVDKDKRQVEHKPMVSSPKMMADGGGILGQQTSSPQSYVGNWLNSSIDTSGPGMAPSANLSSQGANPLAFVKDMKKPGKNKPQSELSDKDINDISAKADPYSNGESDLFNAQSMPSPMTDSYGMMNAADGGLMRKGGKVQAQNRSQRAVKSDDSLSNDKVPAMLSEGEIVIPRHITMHPMAPAMAAQFVANELKKRGKK